MFEVEQTNAKSYEDVVVYAALSYSANALIKNLDIINEQSGGKVDTYILRMVHCIMIFLRYYCCKKSASEHPEKLGQNLEHHFWSEDHSVALCSVWEHPPLHQLQVKRLLQLWIQNTSFTLGHKQAFTWKIIDLFIIFSHVQETDYLLTDRIQWKLCQHHLQLGEENLVQLQDCSVHGSIKQQGQEIHLYTNILILF